MRFTEGKIFIQIPAYRDTELGPTIDDMYSTASNPERLNTVICWQHTEQESLPAAIRKRKKIRVLDIPYQQSLGANWARHQIQQYYNNEPYTLLMDSHLRFVNNWDVKLIKMLEDLKAIGESKPIISGFPPSYFDPVNYPNARESYPLKMFPKKHERGLLTKFYGQPIPFFKNLKSPVRAEFIAMGFLFADGRFNTEIPFDPSIYFFGDDITTAARAFTNGYTFFHPHRIIAWHLYERFTRTAHWEDHPKWRLLELESLKRIREILQGYDVEKYSLGSTKTIAQFQRYIGYPLIVKDAVPD